jgi:hypothetical protein
VATGAVRDLSAEELANAFYVAQQTHARRVADRAQQLWREIDRRDLSRSWGTFVGPQVVQAVVAGQLATAAAADAYVESVIAAGGLRSDPSGRIRPEAFAGRAADGRSLDSLLYLPVVTSKTAIAAGANEVDAMMTGLRQLLRMAASEVTDAGRAATGASIAGNRTINGYIRVVNPPACARCIILAGKEYGWNAGFQRHPRLLTLRLRAYARETHCSQPPRPGCVRSGGLLQGPVAGRAGPGVHGGRRASYP